MEEAFLFLIIFTGSEDVSHEGGVIIKKKIISNAENRNGQQ